MTVVGGVSSAVGSPLLWNVDKVKRDAITIKINRMDRAPASELIHRIMAEVFLKVVGQES
jgi:hypothetical protein